MDEPLQIVEIDLDASYEDTATLVLQAVFPEKLKAKPVYSSNMGMVVFDLVNELWSPIQRILLIGGLDDSRLDLVRTAVTLASWNQVLVDFGGNVEIRAQED